MEDYTSLFSPGNVPMLTQFIGIVIGLGVVVGFLVVFLSMYTAVLERTREIGVLKALGASPVFILNILLRETVLLALAGSLLGILLSYGTRIAVGACSAQLADSSHRYRSGGRSRRGSLWPGAILGALYPGLKAARQDAIEALAYE